MSRGIITTPHKKEFKIITLREGIDLSSINSATSFTLDVHPYGECDTIFFCSRKNTSVWIDYTKCIGIFDYMRMDNPSSNYTTASFISYLFGKSNTTEIQINFISFYLSGNIIKFNKNAYGIASISRSGVTVSNPSQPSDLCIYGGLSS